MKNDKINAAAIQHNITQKSQAIYRQAIKQPVSQIKPFVRKVGHSMDIARSKSVAHFTPHPIHTPINKPNPVKKQFDINPTRHHLAAKADLRRTLVANVAPQATINAPLNVSAKEQMIAQAFDQLDKTQKTNTVNLKNRYKLIRNLVFGLILILAIGYFIFINIPTISVAVASNQSGIKASYPQYLPEGYSLNNPVSYSNGQVSLSFHSNTSNKTFVIAESKSSWDSSAVKNKVNKDSNGLFVTTQENGLTIYTYDDNATWVNGGILYSISGDAPLSRSQIRRIATSL